MAVVYRDRVKETTTTVGVGPVALGGAFTQFQAFSDVFVSGNQTHYTIEGQGTGEWEIGLGTLTTGSPWTLTRTTVLASSNGGAAVNFSAGTKTVYCDVPASVIALIQSAVQPVRQVVAGAGLSGGGDLSADRTIALALTGAIVNTALGYTAANAASLNASALTTGTVPSARLPDPTAAQVGAGTAGLAFKAVGSYVWAFVASSSVPSGGTIAGTSLGLASGTWRSMNPGTITTGNDGLWLRIA